MKKDNNYLIFLLQVFISTCIWVFYETQIDTNGIGFMETFIVVFVASVCGNWVRDKLIS